MTLKSFDVDDYGSKGATERSDRLDYLVMSSYKKTVTFVLCVTQRY
jgi:hypothetical protein